MASSSTNSSWFHDRGQAPYVFCPFCYEQNQTAIACMNRLNLEYQPHPYHPVNNFSPAQFHNAPETAYWATGEGLGYQSWLLDSGATHHLTNQLLNMNLASDYHGNSRLLVEKPQDFWHCGPRHLTPVDWMNFYHRSSVAACLVQGVYTLERDRQLGRHGSQALAPPWWERFQFKLLFHLQDDADLSIFGAIYEFIPLSHGSPGYVIAFRGTLFKRDSIRRDLELDFHIIRNGLHRTSRFDIAMQAVRGIVADNGSSNVWLAGHSLGSALAMLAGWTMAKTGVFLETFLFNPPFVSLPIDSFEYPFLALSEWFPYLFVNRADPICRIYIRYFEHRKEEIGLGSLLKNAMLKGHVHLIPSARLIFNLTPSRGFRDFKAAHEIQQWWKPELNLQSQIYNYKLVWCPCYF